MALAFMDFSGNTVRSHPRFDHSIEADVVQKPALVSRFKSLLQQMQPADNRFFSVVCGSEVRHSVAQPPERTSEPQTTLAADLPHRGRHAWNIQRCGSAIITAGGNNENLSGRDAAG
jgi:hypothetical protein